MSIHKSKYCLVIFHPERYERRIFQFDFPSVPVEIQFFTCFFIYAFFLALALLKEKQPQNKMKKNETHFEKMSFLN